MKRESDHLLYEKCGNEKRENKERRKEENSGTKKRIQKQKQMKRERGKDGTEARVEETEENGTE